LIRYRPLEDSIAINSRHHTGGENAGRDYRSLEGDQDFWANVFVFTSSILLEHRPTIACARKWQLSVVL